MEIDIQSDEKDMILRALNEHFKYDRSYWIPLKEIEIDKPVLVVSDQFALKNRKQIENYLLKNNKSFYLTGEAGYTTPFATWLQEVDFLDLEYGPIEFVYFGKKFDWMIYISHENTVTFCGKELVNYVKTIGEI